MQYTERQTFKIYKEFDEYTKLLNIYIQDGKHLELC